jgi:hypothetical protein
MLIDSTAITMYFQTDQLTYCVIMNLTVSLSIECIQDLLVNLRMSINS